MPESESPSPTKRLPASKVMSLTEQTGAKWRFEPAVNRGIRDTRHNYDEYMIVVQGQYTLLIDGKKIPLRVGEEYFIPQARVRGTTLSSIQGSSTTAS